VPAFFIFFVVAAAAIAAIFGARQQKDRRDAQWRDAAAELDLRFTTATWGYPSIAGHTGGFAVHVDVKKSGGENNTVRTHYRVLYPPLGMGLKLRPENFVTKIGRFFGGQDLEVGDDEFDASFHVKARDPNALRAFMTPSRRLMLLRLVAAYPTVEVNDDGLHLVANGATQSASTIVSIVRRLVSAARQLSDQEDPTGAEMNETIAIQSQGDVGEAARRIGKGVRPHPDDFEVPIHEVEVLHAAGDDGAARKVLEDLSQRLPADPEVVGWRERLETAVPAPPEPAPPQPAPPAPTPPPIPSPTYMPAPRSDAIEASREPSWAPDAVEMASALFGSRRMSFDTDRQFADEYAGKEIEWTGKVRRVTPYERDYDFGETPGTKAVMTVASIANDLYGQTTIDAVVQLSSDSAQHLTHGTTVAFAGTLARIDSLMRNIYVTNGRLV
jgi:hypothetical protein